MSSTEQECRRDPDDPDAAEKIDRRERSLDDALKGSFPASDPPAALAPHHPQKWRCAMPDVLRDGLDYPPGSSILKI